MVAWHSCTIGDAPEGLDLIAAPAMLDSFQTCLCLHQQAMPTAHACRFHDVEPQEGLALLPPPRLSRWVVSGGSKKVPFSRLDENTLTASDELCVCPRDGGMLLVAR